MLRISYSRLKRICTYARAINPEAVKWIRRCAHSSVALSPDVTQSPAHSYVTPSPAHSDAMQSATQTQRRKCEKLQSAARETHVLSVIDGLIHLGMVQLAEPIFNQYRREGHQFDVEVYNSILEGWAAKGLHRKVEFVFSSMSGDGVTPNFQSYATLLESYTRCEHWESARLAIQEMETKGFELKYILHETKLSKSQSKQILKALAHFGVTSEAPPPKEPIYPRVVKSLYVDRSMETRQETNQEKQQDFGEIFDPKVLKKQMQRQFKLELKGHAEIHSVAAISDDEAEETKKRKSIVTLEDLWQQWKSALASKIRKDVEDYLSLVPLLPSLKFQFVGPKHFPFLALLPPEVWADIVVEESKILLGHSEGLPVSHLCMKIGRAAFAQYVIAKKKKRGVVDKVKLMYQRYLESFHNPPDSFQTARELWNQLDRETRQAGSLATDTPNWPFSVKSYVGGELLDKLMEVATIPPSFYTQSDKPWEIGISHGHIYFFDGSRAKKKGYLRPHPRLYSMARKHFSKSTVAIFRFVTVDLPMLIPPLPWTSVTDGGYFVSPVSIVRCPSDTYQHHLLLQEAENFNAVLDSLNFLSAYPWTINTRMLELVLNLFNNGGDEELDIPCLLPPLENTPTPTFKDKEEKKAWRRERFLHKKKQRENYSLWMDMLYRLSLANHYRNEVFWLPNNMDFRGRVYPIPPNLSYTSNDVCRSLLKFAVGCPLGKKGLNWLKIHLVTLHGEKKKATLDERLEYANHLLGEIADSADRPFEGNKWWQTGDYPWQVLACCMEIMDAIRSGDPENFISHIPVHQDGSCNGLQHYAALGRDIMGAKQVNLLPADRPEDPYNGVALLVEKKRKADAENGHEIAKLLEGKISRKVVKQPVMTVVYGVTWVGGRAQISRQLQQLTSDRDVRFHGSQYLIGRVFEVLREMFANAKKIQDWLAASGRKVALAGHPMEWLTPLGLPVVQPYHKKVREELTTPLQKVLRQSSTDRDQPPNTRKQKDGMPPNFVHSLDATHMMLTSLHCQRAGTSFVAVHDSFWTHPCFVDTMNKICREQFVALHSEPILSDLAMLWEKKFGGLKYYEYKTNSEEHCHFLEFLPSIGDFDLREILKSTYFFS